VRERAPEVSEPVTRVTDAFCATRYGGVVLTEAERDEVARAVAELGKRPSEVISKNS
jgi:hypothetical protein